jgi:uncharacterized protein YjbI with pentapeptide repeats
MLSRWSVAVIVAGAVAAAVIASRAAGAGWLPAIGLGVLLGISVLLWSADPSKSWGDLGQGIMVSVVVAIALLAIQNDIEDRSKRREISRDDSLRRADLRRQHASDRQALQLTLGQQKDLSGVDLRNRDLRGFFLAGKNLSNAVLDGARFDRASLRDAKLHSVTAYRARFDEAQLSGADLGDSMFSEQGSGPLRSASFRGANMGGATLRASVARGVDFAGAFLDEANLSRVLLEGARFARASLRSVDLSQAYLPGADFRGADLTGARLCSAVALAQADLNGATFSKTTRWPPGFRADEAGAVHTKYPHVLVRAFPPCKGI